MPVKTARWMAIAALMILLTLASFAYADEKVAFNADSRVYLFPNLESVYVEVGQGLQVNYQGDESGWARVELNGAVGYTNGAHLTKVSENAVTMIRSDAIIARDTRVFAGPYYSAQSMAVPAGMRVELVAISGDWAMVANGNIYAYMNHSDVELVDAFGEGELLAAYPAQISRNAKVYLLPHTASASISVPKGMQVNLLKAQSGWALIENMGIRAYISTDAVALIESAPTAEPTKSPDYSDLMKNAVAMALTADAYVYAEPSESAEKMQLSKGTQVNFLIANGDWALIERSGNYGFIDRTFLGAVATPAPTAKPTENPGSVLDYMNSSKYTNEQKCYFYLTGEMGLNAAAACGVLSNIRAECNFNPNDQTGKYYGLCQWGDGRLSNMKKYCEKNGYDYQTLEGQLRFLQYELENTYPKVMKMLKDTPDTPAGAYEAGYSFCYDYERPASRTASSIKRGNMAKDTYYPKYI